MTRTGGAYFLAVTESEGSTDMSRSHFFLVFVLYFDFEFFIFFN